MSRKKKIKLGTSRGNEQKHDGKKGVGWEGRETLTSTKCKMQENKGNMRVKILRGKDQLGGERCHGNGEKTWGLHVPKKKNTKVLRQIKRNCMWEG